MQQIYIESHFSVELLETLSESKYLVRGKLKRIIKLLSDGRVTGNCKDVATPNASQWSERETNERTVPECEKRTRRTNGHQVSPFSPFRDVVFY